MNYRPTVEDIYTASLGGRGLWVGLFGSESRIVEYAGDMLTDPHVTLAHLGRGKVKNIGTIAELCDALAATAAQCNVVETKLHAVAGFAARQDNPLVWLMEPGPFTEVYVTVRELCDRLAPGVRDAHFAFAPHLTFRRQGGSVMLTMPHSKQPIDFPRLGVQCGNHRMTWPLAAATQPF